MTSNKRLIEMDFPDLILNKQDRSSVSGYHWVETKQLNDENRRHKLCALIKEECGVRMYIPIGSPYEICRKYNFPEKHLGSPIVGHSERECKAMVGLLPCNMFIPTLEFINTISAETWLEIYQDIIRECPDRIESLHRFNFFVLSDNEEYARYYLKCYPFCNIKKDGDNYSYGEKGFWLDSTFRHAVGNVLKFERCYYDDYDRLSGATLPVVTITY